MSCVFCKKDDGSEDMYVCANCVQILSFASEEELQRVYKLALAKWPDKAVALFNLVGPKITGVSFIRKRKFIKPQRTLTRRIIGETNA